jgi:site-specific recombinase XerD
MSNGWVKLPKEAVSLLEQQLQAFRQKFGRDPGPGDPVFFDPSASEPKALSQRQVEEELVQAMQQAGLSEEIINTFKRTGRLRRPVKRRRYRRGKRR